MEEYSLSDKVKVNIYEDLEIDFSAIEIQSIKNRVEGSG